MQLVGMSCAKCDKAINFAPDALGCERCGKAFHTGCIEAGRLCPSCSDDLLRQTEETERTEKEAVASVLQNGRRQFIIGAALLVLLMLVNAAASLLMTDYANPMKLNPFIGIAVSIGLLVGLYLGHFVAKVLVGVQLAFGLLANGTVLCRVLFQNWRGPTLLLCCTVVMLAAAFALLCFSPSVAAYLESNRRPSQRQ